MAFKLEPRTLNQFATIPKISLYIESSVSGEQNDFYVMNLLLLCKLSELLGDDVLRVPGMGARMSACDLVRSAFLMGKKNQLPRMIADGLSRWRFLLSHCGKIRF